MNHFKGLLLFLVACAIIIVSVLTLLRKNKVKNSNEEIIETPLIAGESLLVQSTLDSIYTEILNLRLDHPTIVYSQVLLETGFLSSELYKTNNNLFGMRVSGSRATTSTKIINGYKYFENWRESLLDYGFLQMAFYRNLSEKEYYHKLERVYAEDPNYVNKLKNLQKRMK